MEPRRLDRAERLSIEREALTANARSKLQTGMLLYYSAHDYSRSISKLREAIEQAKVENDDSTTYSSLSVLGQALLQLNYESEAAKVLTEIEQMIIAKKSFVVGDETAFLESAFAERIEVPTVRRIASILAPKCRDKDFKNRLSALAERTI